MKVPQTCLKNKTKGKYKKKTKQLILRRKTNGILFNFSS